MNKIEYKIKGFEKKQEVFQENNFQRQKLYKKIIICLMPILLVTTLTVEADSIDSEIANARTKVGTTTITCSPYGKAPKTKTLAEALKILKPGMTLKLLPGRYNPQDCLIFHQDNLIIEGDGSGGYVNYGLILYGKNCILRNINIRGCQGESIKVIDTKARGLAITASRKRNGYSIVANCAVNSLTIYPNRQNVVIKNCSIVNAHAVQKERKVVQSASYSSRFVGGHVYHLLSFGKLERKGKVEFNKCVLYSEGNMFAGGNKLLTLTLEDNIIYFGQSIISVGEKKTSKKDLKDIYRLKLKGKNLLEKPKFLKEPTARLYTSKNNFILTPESLKLIKGVGCNMGPKGIPVLDEIKTN